MKQTPVQNNNNKIPKHLTVCINWTVSVCMKDFVFHT